MYSKIAKVIAAISFLGLVGMTTVAGDANAGPTKCWKCVGGWCCY